MLQMKITSHRRKQRATTEEKRETNRKILSACKTQLGFNLLSYWAVSKDKNCSFLSPKPQPPEINEKAQNT